VLARAKIQIDEMSCNYVKAKKKELISLLESTDNTPSDIRAFNAKRLKARKAVLAMAPPTAPIDYHSDEDVEEADEAPTPSENGAVSVQDEPTSVNALALLYVNDKIGVAHFASGFFTLAESTVVTGAVTGDLRAIVSVCCLMRAVLRLPQNSRISRLARNCAHALVLCVRA
jgi:hypothetical protein